MNSEALEFLRVVKGKTEAGQSVYFRPEEVEGFVSSGILAAGKNPETENGEPTGRYPYWLTQTGQQLIQQEEEIMQPVAPQPFQGQDQEKPEEKEVDDNDPDLVRTERNTYLNKNTGVESGYGELDPSVKAHPRRRKSSLNLAALSPGQFLFLPGRTLKSVASTVSQNNTRLGPARVVNYVKRKADREDVNPFLPIGVVQGQKNVIQGWEAPESGVVIYCRY